MAALLYSTYFIAGLAPAAVVADDPPHALARARGTAARRGEMTPGAGAGPDPGTKSTWTDIGRSEPRQRVGELTVVGIIVCVSTL